MGINRINHNKHNLFEARILRTIDPKIWASMSSTSSKNRSTLAADVKPMRKDDKTTLLLKYVAGLLTIKAPCPTTEEDIDKIKSYHNIGNAFISVGGTMLEIQKLYVENSGTYNGPINEPKKDYPDYDDVDTDDTLDDNIDNTENISEEPEEIVEPDVLVSKSEEKDYPDYDDVDVEDTLDNINDENETFGSKFETDVEINAYLKTLNRTLARAKAGDRLTWSETDGFVLNGGGETIAICAIPAFKYLDKKNPKTRFMIIHNDEVELGNAGNNGVYDKYYFKKTNKSNKRLSITPGSNYYYEEEINGNFYTKILADNGCKPAIEAKKLGNLNISGVDNSLKNIIIKGLTNNTYLPTLPELVDIINKLPNGRYWTSSIADDEGTENIVLEVNPDKIMKTDNVTNKAKVVTFITL